MENEGKTVPPLSQKRIEQIRQRIRDGFYFTKEVKEIIVKKVLSELLLKK